MRARLLGLTIAATLAGLAAPSASAREGGAHRGVAQGEARTGEPSPDGTPTPPRRPDRLPAAPDAEGGTSTAEDERSVSPSAKRRTAGDEPAASRTVGPPSQDAHPDGRAQDVVADEAACFFELAALDVSFVRDDPPAATAPGCGVVAPVRVRAVGAGRDQVRFEGEPLVACATARAVARFLREAAGPLAIGAAGSALTSLAVSGYECRPRNRVAGAKVSAHGLGMALDIASFGFADGRRFAVGEAAPADKARFFAGLRKAACGYFMTVLGPGSDGAHATHLHLDIEPHGRSGYARICQ